ncbi:MAG TPA: DUF502 domain-containing protein [Hyphomicrobiaceae bacterium]|nr:DUF502 domain-containing protein [Hyphomicrobiaceae bacterium]
MQEQPGPPGPRQAQEDSASLKAELAKLAREDDASDLKAGLAKLALEAAPEPSHVGARLRNYFLTGLVVVGPVTITLYTAWYFINMVDAWVKPYIPRIYNPEYYLHFPVPGVGLLFAIIGLTLIGALAANLIGRSLISAGELMLGRMPIVRNVYQGLKQIFESVVTASSPTQGFQKVALLEFPSKGIWSIVFVTGEAAEQISAEVPGEELVSVFMPTGMLPPSGFVCFVPRSSVYPVRMSVEDAAKIIISAGMVNPETQARLNELARKSKSGRKPAPLEAAQ